MKRVFLSILGVAAVAGFMGCQSAPQDDVDAAQAALSRADSAEADIYAPVTYTAAMDSFAAASVVIEEQDAVSSFSRDYDTAERLLAAAITTAQEAEAEAIQGKADVQAEAETLIAQAQQVLAATPDVMKQTGSQNVETLVNDAVAAQAMGDYITARDLAQQALNQLSQPTSDQPTPRS